MRDYKCVENELDQLDRLDRRFSLAISLVVLVLLIGLICISCVDAVVATAEIEDEKSKTWLAETYQRPLAYRLASPTVEQMERTEALLTLQPLVREK